VDCSDDSDYKRNFLCWRFSVDNVKHYCAVFDRYYPSLWRELIVRWPCFTPPLHLVGCHAALNVIRQPELAHLQTHIFQAQIQQHTIPPEASPRFVRTLIISWRWSTLTRNMINALSAKRNYATRTDWKLSINNITQNWWMKGFYPTGFYHLPASLTLSHDGVNTVGAPEWPSTCCQLMINE